MTKLKLSDVEKKKSALRKLISEGNEVMLCDDEGNPLATLNPLKQKRKRTPGLSKGAVTYISDDFDEALGEGFWVNEPK